jgi:hypothetical protein
MALNTSALRIVWTVLMMAGERMTEKGFFFVCGV